jgi:hypothetical protein
MTLAERRTRIGRRHRLAAEVKAANPVAAAASVVALHGTDAMSVFLSAWARMRDGDVACVERALYEDRALLRVLAMRRTMFVTPLDTAAVLLAACSREVAARERRKLVALVEAAGLGDGDAEVWVRTAEAAALASLAAQGEATAAGLAADDPYLTAELVVGAGTKFELKQRAISRLLTVLGAQGRAVRARPRGSWTSTQFRWAAMGVWHPGAVGELPAAEARVELAQRWLRAFGPATVEDLAWWSGWSLGATRAAIAKLDTAIVELDGAPGIVLADDVEPERAVDPWTALLPALDATTMGWKDRGWYLGDHAPLLFDRNGNASPTVWCDGRVVGGWAQADGGEIRVRLLDDIGADAIAAIDRQAIDLGTRIGDAKLSPRARGRSPIETELLA